MLRGGLRPKHPYPVLGQNPFASPFPFVTIVYFVFKDFFFTAVADWQIQHNNS